MKKIISVILIALSFCLILASCGKSEAAKAIDDKIKNIGDVDLSKGSVIEEVFKEYSLLSGEDKSDVKSYDKLFEKKQQYDSLKTFDDKVNEVAALYDKTLSEYGVPYSDIEQALNELNELMPDEKNEMKGEYDKSYEKITSKQEKYNEVAEKAADSAISYINGLIKAKNLTNPEIKEIGCIAQINDGTTYYLFAITYNDGGEKDKSVYSSARFAGTPTVETMLTHKDNFYSEKVMSDKTNALKSGNIILDANEISNAVN